MDTTQNTSEKELEEVFLGNVIWFDVRLVDQIGITASLTILVNGTEYVFGGQRLFASTSEDYSYIGHFLSRCLSVSGCDSLNEIIGKAVDCIIENDTIVGIQSSGEVLNRFVPVLDFELINHGEYFDERLSKYL